MTRRDPDVAQVPCLANLVWGWPVSVPDEVAWGQVTIEKIYLLTVVQLVVVQGLLVVDHV